MTGIQLLLSGGILLVFLYVAARISNALISLLLFALLAGLAIFLVLFPGNTQWLADRLGVGRGADLVFYVCIVLFLFVAAKLYARIREVEERLTVLTREVARHNALKIEAETKSDGREKAPS